MSINMEYVLGCVIEDIALDADQLYKELMGDQCFCVSDICPPTIDWESDEYNLNIDPDSPLFKPVERVQLDELTNPEKTGAFDVVMKSVRDLFREEYDRSRITGAEYARSFTQAVEAALGNSVQFLLQKDAAYWQSQQGQFDAMVKKMQVDLIKHQIILAQMETINHQITFTAGKIGLMVQKENYCTAVANREITIAKQAELSDAQIKLYNQQVTSYQRDAEVKAARVFTDAWITIKTIDEGLKAPNGFVNESVDEVLAVLKNKNGFV